MGIDVYAIWMGQTRDEEKAQRKGPVGTRGHVGHLHEANPSNTHAIQFLVREAFQERDWETPIPHPLMWERLPRTLELARAQLERAPRKLDPIRIERALKQFRDFVELCGRKEEETGKPVNIIASW